MTTVPAWALGQGAGVQIPKDEKVNPTFRFFVPKDKEKRIIFLHGIETSLTIWEHQFELMNKGKLSWNNFATCLASIHQPCPMCRYAEDMGKYGRTAVQLFSVLDLTPWKDRNGVDHPYSKMVLAAKKGTQALLLRRHMDLVNDGKTQGLLHAQFKVYRAPDEKSPGVGSDYQFLKYSDLSKIPPEDAAPVSWDEFAPNPAYMAKCVARLRGGGAIVGGKPASGGLFDDDDLTSEAPAGPAGPVADIQCDY